MLNLCCDKLDADASVGVTGLFTLGAYLVKSFRSLSLKKIARDNIAGKCWFLCSKIVSYLGKGASQADERISLESTRCLQLALSIDHTQPNQLEDELHESSISALLSISSCLKNPSKFTPAWLLSFLKCAGTLLAVVSSIVSSNSDGRVTEVTQLCVNGLFDMLSTPLIYQDSILGFYVGEALAEYADSSYLSVERLSNRADHSQILFLRLFNDEMKTTSQSKRHTLAIVLLSVLGRSARMVREYP